MVSQPTSLACSGVSDRVLGFIHHLRDADFPATFEEAALISRALGKFSAPNRELSRCSCRAICCRSRDQWFRFDSLFDDYWFPGDESNNQEPDEDGAFPAKRQRGGIVGISGGTELFEKYLGADQGTALGAGRQTTLAKADFRFLGDRVAMRRVEVLAEQLALRVRPRRSRRMALTNSPGRLALGPTLRASVRGGGEPLRPRFLRRRREPPRMLLLHDVSHSMAFNNPMLIRFTRGIVRRFKTAEAFVFHTRLFAVTEIFREPSLSRMQQRLEENNRLWLGGTCIADSLEQYLGEFARGTLKRDSLVIIISDGFDANEPERLAAQLQELKRRCRRIIWLNPMLEREGFNPDKEEVWNVRRNVDRLLPAHSLDALRRSLPWLAERTA